MSDAPLKVLLARSDGLVIADYLLGEGIYMIGSGAGAQLKVETATELHARLEVHAGDFFIEDTSGPGGGTFLDGAAVLGRVRAYPGQTIQAGDCWIQLQSNQPESGSSQILAARYKLIKQLGRGGRGEVWLALDEQTGDELAIKRLPAELAGDTAALNDLTREVQKSRNLDHPNIIRIHELVQPEGEPAFVTLEYVDGQDLASLRLQQPGHLFAWENLRPLMTQLCDALEYAHQHKIVHRDLKPANMLVDRHGNLKLADFGIAATMAESLSRSSIQGSVSGTSVFMSPQQMRGELPRASDDLYALGSTFYELLTSRTPFYSGDITYQVLNEMPKPLAERVRELGLQNQVPDAVCAMIMACLAKDPAHRPPSAVAVEEWISSGATEMPPVLAPPTLPSVPATLGQEPSDLPPPPVAVPAPASPSTVHQRVAAGWAGIETRDNPWYQGFMAVAALFTLLLVVGLKGTPRHEIVPSVVKILILWAILSAIGKYLLKPKRFFCSECDGKLKNDKPAPCPHCGAALS